MSVSGRTISKEVLQLGQPLMRSIHCQIAVGSVDAYSWNVLDDVTIEDLNRGYVCPPDAGPAWRAACDYGLDMSLVEEALRKTPEQRLEEHQHALERLSEIEVSRQRNAPG